MKKRQHPGETLAQPNESSIHTVRWILSAAAVLVVLAHLYAAFFPSGMNWGFHQLGFFSPIGKVGVPFLMLLFIIPPIQLTILRVIFRMTELLSRYKRSVKVALIFFLLVGSAFAFWVGRERVFFLGDGNMIVRTMPKVNNLDDIPRVFPNEPLAGFILWKGYQLCQSWNLLPSEEFPIQVVNAAFGVGCVFLFVLLVRQISSGVIDQVLVFAFIIAAGGTQLLFGYVEDYPPLYFGLILYLWLALSSLQGNTHPALPSMAFGFMFALHFGMVVMVPSLVLLWYDQVRKKQWSVVVKSCIATVLTVILLLGLSGYTVDLFFSVFLKSRSHLLAASHTTSDDQAYTFFSLAHLNDLVNLQLLLAPFAL
ncbi:MAG: hypothetical protein HY277_07870, partial [Ignavibacteriales bacterium]|nr:hypothetical protein [Ignavibacteriales bacterium]